MVNVIQTVSVLVPSRVTVTERNEPNFSRTPSPTPSPLDVVELRSHKQGELTPSDQQISNRKKEERSTTG